MKKQPDNSSSSAFSYKNIAPLKKYISEVVGREITLLGRPPEQHDNTQNNPSENKNNSDEDDLPF